MAEFKIGRLRYTWKGYWGTNTFYNRDAVVAYNGKTYVCLEPHTSGSFYADLERFDPVLGSIPYWTIMLEGTQWKGEWQPNTGYTLGNIVLYTGTLYLCTTNHTSGSTSISLANWSVYVFVNGSWSNDYTPSTVYRVGESVRYNGIVYRCTTAHTSTSASTIDYTKWEILNIGVEYKSSWDSTSFEYRKNDIVKFGANLWIATEDHVSSLPFDEDVWNLWIPGLEFGTSWNNATTYQVGDVVRYGGYAYTNKVSNNTGNNPSTSVTWELLTTGYDIAGEWNNVSSYRIGSIVRRSGNVFVAIKDSNGQDPTSGELSKLYVASGSSGVTVKLINTSNLAIGMTISGNGFDKGQYITAIVDETTIEVSQAPYSFIENGDLLKFSGVNKENWELISSGTAWKNRWAESIAYVTGDYAVWNNATYKAIKNHISSALYRPDLDTTREYWVVAFNHDQYNVLNQPGDIVVNTEGINEALTIGSEGFLLKSVNGIPTWSNVFQTPAVYYVTPDGDDAITSGDTWDNPYGSIRYACQQIANGSLNANLKSILALNKQFIVEEVSGWVNSQIALSAPPFSSTDIIDNEKVKRDTSFLIDAVVYDASRGGNSQTIAFVYSYFDKEYSNKFVTPEVAELMPQFIAAISRTFVVIDDVLNNVQVAPIFQQLQGGVITEPQIITQLTVGSQALIDVASFQTIIVSALTAGNTNRIPPENQGLTTTLMVKTGTYTETLPIIVPANTALNGDELRGVVVKPKIVIDTIAIRTQTTLSRITVKTTVGMSNNTPVQFASINPVSGVNSVFGGLVAGVTYYVIGNTITDTTFSVSEQPGGTEILLSNGVSQMRVYGGDALSDMFYVQNGTGIRNMTLTGLLGTLTSVNSFETRRPTGGAYVSLDPGLGPDDTSAWIYRKSPYIQNVTTFGTGAVGLKIDGELHNGGNKSVVCNDFTQILSDGIGIWCTGPDALCEAVSVFSYYAYAGYFAEDGGRIRATNGNSSYGTFGVIAEGFNSNESPIIGKIDNRYFEATATPLSSLGANAEILKLQYSHAGEEYTADTTNLLLYSNLFTNWAGDGNVTLIQSIVSPSGQSDGWIATGNTSGTDSSYFYQDVEVAPSGATYTALVADSQTGGGAGATFDVIATSTQYLVTVNNGGSGYVTTTQLTINGSQLGGLNGVNDLVITIESLIGNSISTISTQGVVQVGSIQPYTCSIFCKKGTSPLFDVTATFSGYSTAMSGISFNFTTEAITPINATGGMLPTQFQATPVSGRPGWYRISFQFYDTSALNDSLQIRVYPRSRLGNSGYTILYGSQLEIGNTLGFYLTTTTEKFTSYANFEVVGAGSGVALIGDELRFKSVYQTRILEVDGNTGGTNYLSSINNAQTGDEVSITIAGSDTQIERAYIGMRVFINSGVGAGQYGVIASFNVVSKIARVIRESFSPITVLLSDSVTDQFEIASSDDPYTLYEGQPVQFVPTRYTTSVTRVSQNSIAVVLTTGGTTNTITLESTARLAVNMPIVFTGTTGGGITTGFTYYVLSIVNNTDIQISTVLGGAVTLLNSTVPVLLLNYPSGTSRITAPTDNMEIALPIYFTGNVFSNIVPGQIYYINEIYGSDSFAVSSDLAIITASNTTENTNYITVNDTSTLRSINPIVFTGTTFGGIPTNTKRYVSHIVDLTRITISDQVFDTIASVSTASSNLVTVGSTAGFIIGNPVIFSGTTFSGIVNERIYFIHYVNNSTTFSISSTSILRTITATQTFVTTNNITVDDSANLTLLNPIKFVGTGFGQLLANTPYFISRIINPTTIRVSTNIISVTATSTEAVSNLITVTSTTGFVANNPIVFGGTSIGGLTSGTIYHISAINNETSLTVSEVANGAAVTLTTDTGTMTARTPSDSITLTTATGSLTGYSRYTGTGAITLPAGVGECNVRTTGELTILTTDIGTLTGTSTVVKETLNAASGSMTGTFSVPLFGGISPDTTYFVNTIATGATNKFTISESIGGPAVALPDDTGSMRIGELGWDNVNPGVPLVPTFNSTTVYSIEPLVTYSNPNFGFTNNTNVTIQAPGTSYVSIGFGDNKFVALPNSGQTLSVSPTGALWSPQQLPSSGTWSSIAYGVNYWVIISSGGTAIPGSKVLYSNSNLVTWKTSFLPSIGNWHRVVYGNGKFVAITNNSSSAAYSTNFGSTWSAGTGLPNTTWSDLAYGNGLFVAVATGGTVAAYTDDGITWNASTLPSSTLWSSVKFGNGRFVAISSDSAKAAYSLDGITWYESNYVVSGTTLSYGNGVFLAVTVSSTVSHTSEDGLVWFRKTIPTGAGATVFGFSENQPGAFVGVSGQNIAVVINAGSRTKSRAQLYQGKIAGINEWDPGANYNIAPPVSIFDPNATRPAFVETFLGNGVLGNPTFYNKGSGYNTTSTAITITGTGYAQNYQSGSQLIFKDLLKLPSPGDNLTIEGSDIVYKITEAVVLDGTTAPNIRALIGVDPTMTEGNSPEHDTLLTIRTKYSQVRLTNHDFLNIGYGNFEESNYPRLPLNTLLSPENEAVESNYGRVFYSSTDQDGNFRVGKLFAVEQATGIVTLSASQFGLEGLSQLRLGGISVGGVNVVIQQFSTDSTFVANSNNIIVTQRAIKSYLTARLSQGGSNTFTGQLIAGTVLIGGPDQIRSTIPEGNEGSRVNIPVKVNVTGIAGGGWDGDGMAMSFFMKHIATR